MKDIDFQYELPLEVSQSHKELANNNNKMQFGPIGVKAS